MDGTELRTILPSGFFDGLNLRIFPDAPIGQTMTWYRIGGKADYLVEPATISDLCALVRRCREHRFPFRVLGSGANLLIDDEGVDGIVVRLCQDEFVGHSWVHRHRAGRGGPVQLASTGAFPSGGGHSLRVMAGEKLERLVQLTAKQGMSGLESMAGIPASVGGAVRMNAGGKYGSIGDRIAAVGVVDFAGSERVYAAEDIQFEYRRTSLVDPVILWAEFRLEPEDPDHVRARVREIFQHKTGSQPMSEKSCGCVFKNPLCNSHDLKPTFAPDSYGRISAGALIDRAGLKGVRIGDAEISPRHANFITVDAKARARDVMSLMDHAARAVKERFGYELHPEIVIWRRRSMEGEKTL